MHRSPRLTKTNTALSLLLALGAALGQYALLVPLVLLQAVTAAGWFRLNGMWPARQGIALAFAAGAASVVSKNERHDRWFAIPLGIGAALTMDEAALLVELEDVYWSEEGILSVQATLGTLALFGATMLGARAFRRGEPEILGVD